MMQTKMFLTLLLLANGLHAKITTVLIEKQNDNPFTVIFTSSICPGICKTCSLKTGERCSYEWQENQKDLTILVQETLVKVLPLSGKTVHIIKYLNIAALENDLIRFPSDFNQISDEIQISKTSTSYTSSNFKTTPKRKK